jgi:hypothetical protein
MPFGDGTGPSGQGPRTGRGSGYCADSGRPGYLNPAPRRAFGFRRGGFGFGRGWSRGWGCPGWGYPGYQSAPLTPNQEKKILLDEKKALGEEAKALKQELEEIKERIQELEKGPQK